MNKKTRGVDGIFNNLIKIMKHDIGEPLTITVNNSLEYGIFPEILKVAIVKLLYEKGYVNDFHN